MTSGWGFCFAKLINRSEELQFLNKKRISVYRKKEEDPRSLQCLNHSWLRQCLGNLVRKNTGVLRDGLKLFRSSNKNINRTSYRPV